MVKVTVRAIRVHNSNHRSRKFSLLSFADLHCSYAQVRIGAYFYFYLMKNKHKYVDCFICCVSWIGATDEVLEVDLLECKG
jgi:hypothetical protein